MPKKRKTVRPEHEERYSSGLLNRYMVGTYVNESTREKLEAIRKSR
jgi:hypothetical protein